MTTQSTSDSAHSNQNASFPRGTWVFVGVMVTLLLTAGVLSLLLYRALFNPEPSRVLIIRANSDWQGAIVRVEGESLSQPVASDVQEAGNYIVPFFLWPGEYTVHVLRQDTEVYAAPVDLRHERSVEIDLTQNGAATRPAIAPS